MNYVADGICVLEIFERVIPSKEKCAILELYCGITQYSVDISIGIENSLNPIKMSTIPKRLENIQKLYNLR